jgi:hypothetical protein
MINIYSEYIQHILVVRVNEYFDGDERFEELPFFDWSPLTILEEKGSRNIPGFKIEKRERITSAP